ncbi:hypothetical protein BS35_006112 [Actinomadura glauciflava]|nr:hypothetical protein [Actinomadura glauciflava]
MVDDGEFLAPGCEDLIAEFERERRRIDTQITELITWLDGSGDTGPVLWSNSTPAGQTVAFTGVVTTGRYLGDGAIRAISGIGYVAISSLADDLLLTSWTTRPLGPHNRACRRRELQRTPAMPPPDS